MFQNLTLNSILIMIFGLALMIFGVWTAVALRGRVQGVGMVFTGLGIAILGFTNGFTDFTPLGRFLYRIAIAAFLVGVPISLYYLYLLIFRG
jgi:uncharacterized membrane protein